jgi:FkbM family methyltransferase
VKRILRRAFRRAGIDVVRFPVKPARDSLPAHLARSLAYHPVDGVVDVGAHRGGFVGRLRDVGFGGPIVSFEPDPENFGFLASQYSADQRWDGHNIGLGSKRGTLLLNQFADSDFNSFRIPTRSGAIRFPGLATATHQAVPVERLDDVLDMSGALMLKTDTQGFDLEVIAGARDTLKRVEILVIELSVQPIYEGMPGLLEMLTEICRLGFVSAGFSIVSLNGASVVEYDGVFVRARHLGGSGGALSP